MHEEEATEYLQEIGKIRKNEVKKVKGKIITLYPKFTKKEKEKIKDMVTRGISIEEEKTNAHFYGDPAIVIE